MGYILPITPFTYNDYQNRVTKEEPYFYNIEKPYKVILEMQHEQADIEYSKGNLDDEKQSILSKDVTPKVSNSKKLYAQLTGKGSLFRESV